MNKADSLNCIRHIAESFIAKHAPDEIRYFPIIWNRFCSENLFSQQLSQVSILTFAEQNNIGLVSPSVLFVLKGVMFELKTKIDKPSLEKVRNAVRACAIELGAPKDIAVSLEQNLSVMVYENLLNLSDSVDNICNAKFPQRRSLRVNSVSDIHIDNQKTEFEAQQPLILLCELLRKNKLHWGSAFLLFPKWCNGTVENPKDQFKNLANKINMFMQQNGLELRTDREEDDRGKTGYIRLIVPGNIEISGDIIESQNLIKEAEGMIKEGRNKDALDNTVKAFNKDAGWLRPMIVFAEAINGLGPELSGDLRGSVIAIQRNLKYNRDLRINAVTAMEKYSSLDNRDDLSMQKSDYAGEINQIIQALKILDQACEGGGVRLTPQELEYDLVCDLLGQMRNSSSEEFTLLYKRLLVTECVKEVIHEITFACNCGDNYPADYEEMTEFDVSNYFSEYIFDLVRFPTKYNDIGHLKKSWIKSVKNLIERNYKTDSPGHGGEPETYT